MTRLEAISRYLAAGLSVIPIWPDSRKNPHLTSYSEFYYQLPTLRKWKDWLRRWPDCNIGGITGYSKFIALDFDHQADFDLWVNGPGRDLVGKTWVVQTARGYHVWFKAQDDPGSSRSYFLDDKEFLLRARGGYCIIPPSVHHSGAKYKTINNTPPMLIKIADIVDDWEAKARPVRSNPVKPVLTGPARIQDLVEIVSKPDSRGVCQARCPLSWNHNNGDVNPSAWVNLNQQRFGCHKCYPGQWLDVINLFAEIHGLTNKEAYHIIKSQE